MTTATRFWTTQMTRTAGSSLLALGLLAGAGCEIPTVPDFHAGSIDELTSGNASSTVVATAAQGLMIGTRQAIDGVVITWGEVGREGYSLDPTNPPNQTRRLKILDRSLAAGDWSQGYENLRQAGVVLNALESVTGMSDAEKEAIRGWTKTLMAIDFLMLINVFDQSGVAIDVDRPVDGPLAPIVSKEEVFQHIVTLLDEAKMHLLAGGDEFPFTLSPGFSGFTTPATFAQVNRAIKVRVDVYMKNWDAALTSLAESFIDTSAPMSSGVYNSYSTSSGDAVNPLFDPLPRTQVAHQSTIPDAQLRADGTPDLRATEKTAPIATRITNGIEVDLKWTIYNSPSAPLPIIKNEELILLRAEANYHLGNGPAALADVNVVRQESGGLPPIPAYPGADEMLDEILYNRRYSLLWEGAHRWIDARRYGRLAQLPRYAPDHMIFPYAPLPEAECSEEIRSPVPAGCAIPEML